VDRRRLAKVEAVVLDDGSQVEGRRLTTRPVFRTLDGRELAVARITRSIGRTAYVSFPPFPSVIMLPARCSPGAPATTSSPRC